MKVADDPFFSVNAADIDAVKRTVYVIAIAPLRAATYPFVVTVDNSDTPFVPA